MFKQLNQLRQWISQSARELINAQAFTAVAATGLFTSAALAAPPVLVSYSSAGATYTQNFDSLVYSGGVAVNGGATATIGNATGNPTTARSYNVTAYAANAPWLISDPAIDATATGTKTAFGAGLAGWYSSAGVKSQIAANEGSQSTGGLVSYGPLTSSNRALGLVCSSSNGNTVFGLCLKNDTGLNLTRVNLSFTGEVWRQGTLNKSLTFGYLIDNTGAATLPNAAATADTQAVGTTLVSSLSVTGVPLAGTTVAVNGLLPANQQAKGVTNMTIPNWAPNGILWLTWDMFVAGNGHGLAIDDLTFSATEVSTNANLASLVPSPGALSPSFDSAITTYTDDVANPISNITFTPTTANAAATVQVRVNGGAYATVASASPSASLSLHTGANTVDVRVTAQDTTTIKTYTTTVNRALSSTANLSALALSAGALAPVFNAGTNTYTTNVGNATMLLNVTPTVADATATVQVRVNGGSYTMTSSGSPTADLALNVGANPIDLKVTAQDGTIRIYTVTVMRQASSDVDLSALTLSAGALSPTFDAGTLSYSIAVPNTVVDTTVTASASLTSTITVNGTSVTSGTASAPISLNIGANPIDVIVTAQDLVTMRATRVTVNVYVPAAITTHPTGTTIASGNTATLSAVVAGTPVPTLQWYSGISGDTSTPIGGETSASFTTPVLSASANYWLRATNIGGSVNSNTAAVNVTVPPAFTTQPAAATTIATGNTVTLSAAATGNPAPTYQWYIGTTGVLTTPVVGETSSSFTTPVLTTTTRYWVQASNSMGTANSGTAVVNVTSPAIIVTPPTDTAVVTGSRAGFRVVASGAPTPTFQWYVGNTGDISTPFSPSGTAAVLNTLPLTAPASYWVRVSNSTGTVDSATVSVAILPLSDYTSSNRDVTAPNTGPWNPAGINLNGTQFINLGLQGVGRLPATAIDPATGESLGSISDLQVSNFSRQPDGSYSGTFQTLPDRGYNAGSVFSNYAARINAFNFTFRPYTANAPTTAQNQITMTFAGATRFTYDNDGNPSTPLVYTTGLLATGTASLFGTTVPVATGNSTQSDGIVADRLTLDSEGLVLDRRVGKSGSGWIGDEYGGYIYHFNAAKQIDGQLQLPQALVPHALIDPLNPLGGTTTNFAADPPANGRRINQGMEGLSQSPDGTKLFGLLQSATIQDSGPGNLGRINTRLVVYNVSSTDLPNDPAQQYILQLPRIDTDAVAGVDRNGAQSSILALNNHQILILSRDGNGRGSLGSPVFKSILLADTDGATNIDGLYDAESDAAAPNGVLNGSIIPLSWKEALNLLGKLNLSITDIAKFGLNLNADAASDINSLCEKWEALALTNANDPANPNDFFLFVGNDNDFLTGTTDPLDTAHKGYYLDANNATQPYGVGLENDTIMLAYRVRIVSPDITAFAGANTASPVLADAQPTALSFNNSAARTKSITIKDSGITNLTPITTSIDGPNAANFSVTTAPASSLAPGASSTLVITFNPTTTGVKNAVLHILSNAGGTLASFDINLTGSSAVSFTGIASGDADTSSAILWARVNETLTTPLTAQVSTDATFSGAYLTFSAAPVAPADYTTKVTATGLTAGTSYFYRWVADASGEMSNVGRFKTPPTASTAAPVHFAFSGDIDGLIRPYALASQIPAQNLDFYINLGDVIYENASNLTTSGAHNGATWLNSPSVTLSNDALNFNGVPRAFIPAGAPFATQAQLRTDYAKKYRENFLPVNAGGQNSLQDFYAAQGNYTTWDNHELGNRKYIDGGAAAGGSVGGAAGTDMPTGRGVDARNNGAGNIGNINDVNISSTDIMNRSLGFKAMRDVFLNYQPIADRGMISAPADPRTDGTPRIYSATAWGKNATYINTDARSYRDIRLKNATASADDTGARADNPNRTYLGATQFAWLKQKLLDAQASGTTWKFVSISDPIDQIGPISGALTLTNLPSFGTGSTYAPVNADGGKAYMGGYRAERNALLKFIADNHITNVVFLSTDDHQNRINELAYSPTGQTNVQASYVKVPFCFSVVCGPLGATGPDLITNHTFAMAQQYANSLFNAQVAAGVEPNGLMGYPGLHDLVRDGHPAAGTAPESVDFYSPDTFNFTTLDVSADGKTLSIASIGMEATAQNAGIEYSAGPQAKTLFSFAIDAQTSAYGSPVLASTQEETAVEVTLAGNVGDTFSIVSAPSAIQGTLSVIAADKVTFTPTPNFAGLATFIYQSTDGITPVLHEVTVTVDPINDAPTLAIIPVTTVNNTGATTINLVATPGPVNEGAQTLTFTAVSSDPSIVPNPAVTAAGVMTITPVALATGSVVITVTVQDNGGTANGGIDTAAQMFTLNVISPATFRFDVATSSVAETVGTTTLNVLREGNTSVAATVVLNTANGTALAGTDYTAVTAQTISFAPGDTTMPVTIAITNRPGVFANRTFTATLSAPSSPSLLGTTPTETITITESEAALALGSATGIVREDAGKINLVVTRTGLSTSAVSVQLDTANGTAIAGSDYAAVTGLVLNFAPGEVSKTVPVTVINRGGYRPARTFTATLSNITGALLVTPIIETVTINEADSAALATGPSSSATPYVQPLNSGWQNTALLSVGDAPPLTGTSSGQTYPMVGIPDGLGAYDNGDGTITVLMNHELGNTLGAVRDHGGKGAFVSEWIINKSTLQVVSGSDLMKQVYGWNATTQTSDAAPSTFSFQRFCSADLPDKNAFYNHGTGKGSQARIFMGGEEGGATGYALAHIASGPDKGKSYILGKMNLATNGSGINAVGAWENLLASPFVQDKTVLIGTNDGGSGIMNNTVSVYVGTKTATGTEVDKAGLNNGTLKFVNVTGVTQEITTANAVTRATAITSGTRFTLSATSSTTFSRPEDGAWNPANLRQFFFVTTDRIDTVMDGLGSQVGRTRLWRLTFDDMTDPDHGGSIDLLVEGGAGNDAVMFDNICVTEDGKVALLEDVGGAAHNGKVWFYDPTTAVLTKIMRHDVSRFGDVLAGVVTPVTAPFNNDEETSGIIDVTRLFGGNHAIGDRYYLFVDQAHYSLPSPLVEGGQLLLTHQLPQTLSASTASTPYIQSVDPSVQIRSLLTVGDAVPLTGTTTGQTYQMAGIPDGLGAYDNGNGTLTLLMNHEIGNSVGVLRAHGSIGSFVSEWIIDKATLAVLSGSDLMKSSFGWNSVTQSASLVAVPFAFTRLCSADLPPVSAFYNAGSGLGTQERLFMNGEEGGVNGYALAHIATGSNKGKSYVLGKLNLATNGSATGLLSPVQAVVTASDTLSNLVTLASVPTQLAIGAQLLGANITAINTTTRVITLSGFASATITSATPVDFTLSGVGAWENLLANSHVQDKTIVMGTNDGGTGIMNGAISVYIGTKTNTGNEIDKAGLNNGTMKFVKVAGAAAEITDQTTRATSITNGRRFSLEFNSSTAFSRPEDGAWNPMNDREFFFVTTDRLDTLTDGVGTQIGRTRLWRLTFDDITNPDTGGTIDIMVTGGIGNDAVMWDNITVTRDGKIVLQEDVGGAAHNGKIWFYDPATNALSKIAKHDAGRFGDIASGGIAISATAPFTNDEETSGVIEVSALLGAAPGERIYLLVDQAHYTTGISAANVEGGQLLLMRQKAPSTAEPPVATFVNATVIEESSTGVEVALTATDANGDTLTYSIVNAPNAAQGTVGALVGNKVTFTPIPDFSGLATFTFRANDGTSDSNVATVFVTVTDINDAPTLATISDLNLAKNALAIVPLVSTAGPPSEQLVQTLTITATSSNTAVIPNSTSTSTSLTIAPVAGATGTATITVTVQDSGGTANGGIDTTSRTFTVTVTEQNYAAWVAANFTVGEAVDPAISGPAANPDGDARSNAFEYALGSLPKAFDSSSIIRQFLDATGLPVLRVAQGPGDNALTLQVSSSSTSGFTTAAWAPENSSDRIFIDAAATPAAPRYARLAVLLAGETTPLYSEVYSIRAVAVTGASGTFASAPLAEPRLAVVTVVGVSGSSLTPSSNAWPADLLMAGPCYVTITSGSNAGVTSDITGLTAGILTLSDDLSGIALTGDGLEIRRHHTFRNLFDRSNAGTLAPGLNSTVADNVQFAKPDGSTETFFNFNGTGPDWMDNNFVASGSRVINPEQAFFLRRKTTTAVTLFQQGVVMPGRNGSDTTRAAIVPIETGSNLVTSPAERSVTLAQLGLYTGNPATGLASGVNVSSADRLVIPQPNGTMKTYYYFSNGTIALWVDSAGRPAGTVSLPPGTAFYIVRKAPRAAFPWAMP